VTDKLSHDVVVCVHNGLDDVKLCLSSLVNFWDIKGLNKLIVVNDCSGNETTDYLDGFAESHDYVQVLNLASQHYYTKAANVGLVASKANLRTLLNSDTIVTKNWWRKIQKVFGISPAIGIVGPLSNAASTQSVPFVKSSKDQTAINELPAGVSIDKFGQFIEKSGTDVVTPFVPLVHGFCLTIRDTVLNEIGYFDEEAFPRGYGEENDFCFRAEDAGFVLAVAVDTFVFHAKSKSYTSADRVKFMRDGMHNFSRKHGADRIRKAVTFMEQNVHLQSMRDAVLAKWPKHYNVD